MQPDVERVDAVARGNAEIAVASQPESLEALIIRPAALRAGPVTGSQGRRLIEEEELRVPVGLHHSAPATTKFEQTGYPAAALPA
jgi:hypothetical protein